MRKVQKIGVAAAGIPISRVAAALAEDPPKMAACFVDAFDKKC